MRHTEFSSLRLGMGSLLTRCGACVEGFWIPLAGGGISSAPFLNMGFHFPWLHTFVECRLDSRTLYVCVRACLPPFHIPWPCCHLDQSVDSIVSGVPSSAAAAMSVPPSSSASSSMAKRPSSNDGARAIEDEQTPVDIVDGEVADSDGDSDKSGELAAPIRKHVLQNRRCHICRGSYPEKNLRDHTSKCLTKYSSPYNPAFEGARIFGENTLGGEKMFEFAIVGGFTPKKVAPSLSALF